VTRTNPLLGWGYAQPQRRRALMPEDLKRMCIPEVLWRVKLHGVQDSVRNVVHNYLFKIDTYVKQGVGLFIVGERGVGKTSIAALVAKEARMRGHTVFFTPVYMLREAVKSRVNFDEDITYLKRCRDVDVLILDDLHAADLTGFDARLVEDLLSYRKQAQRVTVVTTSEKPTAWGDKASELKVLLLGSLVTLDVQGENLNEERHEALSKEVLGA